MVLARKAGSIWPREAVGNWLYGVTVRVAREARAVSAKRLARETSRARLPELATSDPRPDDIGAVLDEELAELPDKFRTLLVLCDLRGEPQTEIAARLGLPVGTVYSRLAEARKRLAARLRARGVILSASGLAVSLGQSASAAVPIDLCAKAVAAAMSPASVHTAAMALSHGVLRNMLFDKLKAAVPLAAVALGLVTCAVLAAQPGDPELTLPAPPKPAPVLFIAKVFEPVPAKAEPKPVLQGPNKILFYRAGTLVLIDPDGKNEKKVSEDRGIFHPGDARLAPDGKSLAVLHRIEIPNDPLPGERPKIVLHVRGLDEKEPGTNLGVECQMFFWSPDGSEIVYSDFEDGLDKKLEATHGIVNIKTKEKTTLKVPTGHMITDWSRDGKYFLTTSIDGVVTQEKLPIFKLHLMNRDGTEHKALTDGKKPSILGRLSPDGKRVLFMEVNTTEKLLVSRVMHVLDIAFGEDDQGGGRTAQRRDPGLLLVARRQTNRLRLACNPRGEARRGARQGNRIVPRGLRPGRQEPEDDRLREGPGAVADDHRARRLAVTGSETENPD